jgi:hypothetical protein
MLGGEQNRLARHITQAFYPCGEVDKLLAMILYPGQE